MTISTDELRKLLEAATPGPWAANETRSGFWISADLDPWVVVGTEDDEGRYGAIKNEANARAIATWPDLAAELIAARAKIAAAEKLAVAARYFYEYGENDRAVLAALTAWEALK